MQTIIPTGKLIENNYLNRFISFLDASPKTVETYSRAVLQFFKYLNISEITSPTRNDIINWREILKATKKPTTVQNYIIAVRLFFRFTEEEGLYPNIADNIKGSKIDKNHKKSYLTGNQVKNILSNIDTADIIGARDYAIIALMTTGGLRTIEVSRANFLDIRPVGTFTALFIQGKGHEERTDYIKIQPQVENAVRHYLSLAREISDFSVKNAPLFISTSNNNRGERISARTVSGIVKNRLRESGYDSEFLTAHSLRHTAVTLSLLGGLSIQEVQMFARHSAISTTEIYAHNLERENSRCEEIISNFIFY